MNRKHKLVCVCFASQNDLLCKSYLQAFEPEDRPEIDDDTYNDYVEKGRQMFADAYNNYAEKSK